MPNLLQSDEYILALHSVDGLGPIRLKTILDYFKDPRLAWQASFEELVNIGIPKGVVERLVSIRKTLDPNRLLDQLKKDKVSWLTIFDPSYPRLLKEIYDPPLVLYYKGQIGSWIDKSIAVVGTRKITGYGKTITEQFTKDLISADINIVSGLARGVDSAAHWTAVREKGHTVAVLGGGLNKIYPPENKNLAEEIVFNNGAVVSEFPPDYSSLPGNFPARNRIISGLSLVVLVIEAAEDSGSLITAKLALEQGREVFAVPGPINSQFSRGPINLIKEGAKVALSAEDILDELGISRLKAHLLKTDQVISKQEQQVLDILSNENMHVDEICRSLNFPIAYVSAMLLKMEISGLVKNLGGGIYCIF